MFKTFARFLSVFKSFTPFLSVFKSFARIWYVRGHERVRNFSSPDKCGSASALNYRFPEHPERSFQKTNSRDKLSVKIVTQWVTMVALFTVNEMSTVLSLQETSSSKFCGAGSIFNFCFSVTQFCVLWPWLFLFIFLNDWFTFSCFHVYSETRFTRLMFDPVYKF